MSRTNLGSAGRQSKTKVPTDLRKALAASPKAKAQWASLTSIAHRDFVRWVESAKQSETRARRVERTCDMLAKGKRRPCCYSIMPMDLYKAFASNPKAKAQWADLTPDERRNFVDWVESDGRPGALKLRIDKACATLAAGRWHP